MTPEWTLRYTVTAADFVASCRAVRLVTRRRAGSGASRAIGVVVGLGAGSAVVFPSGILFSAGVIVGVGLLLGASAYQSRRALRLFEPAPDERLEYVLTADADGCRVVVADRNDVLHRWRALATVERIGEGVAITWALGACTWVPLRAFDDAAAAADFVAYAAASAGRG